MAIITSPLDTDFYKFTMQQVVFKKFPDVEVEYTFKNRTKGRRLLYDDYGERIAKELDGLSKLRFKQTELDYLKSLGLFSRGYLEYLKTYRFNPDNVALASDKYDLVLQIRGTMLNGM